MSVHGYLSTDKPQLTMPPSESGIDNLGIRFEGPVLSGLAAVPQQLRNQASPSPQTSAQIREIAPGGASYLPAAALHSPAPDPRLQPDPLRDAQRRQLGGRHDLCDPVIRFHTGLPPLPDPHEERRRLADYWQKERAKHVLP